MAAKNQQDAKQDNKRKLTAGAKTEIKSSASKKQKLISSKPSKNNQSKEFKKPFNPIKGKQSLTKPKFEKSVANEGKMQPPTKRERRLHAKELAEARKKKRKRHYDLEQELASLWEKMRRRNIAKEDRSKLVSEAIRKMKGKIPEIAGSHVSSRVLQTCVKYCSQDDRDTVFEELQPHFLTLADNTYAVHLVKKMLDNASKKQLVGFISALHGHVGALLRHMVGSVVVEHAYQLGNATQKQEILIELYSTELQLFKDLVSTKQSRLVDVISKLGLQKGLVLRHMTSVIQPILEKGIVDHSIIHKLLIEYFSIADKTSAADVIQQLSGPLLVRMIHTKDGSRIGMLCVKHGSAKERKKIIKGMKGHIGKITHDQYGCLVLLCIVTLVDDTKLVKKIVIREVQPILKELVMDKSGRRVLLQLLHPNCSRYLSPDDLASLNSSIPSLCSKDEPVKTEEPNNEKADLEEEEVKADESTNPGENLQSIEGGKKDPQVRRQELLVGSGLAESVIDICIENTGELLRSNFGKEVVYEVARGGSDDILRPSFDDKLNTLHEAIASLAAESKSEESQEEHILENFHSSRSLRKLVIDCPTFASTLWKNALAGKCELWAQGHGSKVVSAYLESSNSTVRELAKEELQPLVDRGMLKIPDRNQKAESNAKMKAETP